MIVNERHIYMTLLNPTVVLRNILGKGDANSPWWYSQNITRVCLHDLELNPAEALFSLLLTAFLGSRSAASLSVSGTGTSFYGRNSDTCVMTGKLCWASGHGLLRHLYIFEEKAFSYFTHFWLDILLCFPFIVDNGSSLCIADTSPLTDTYFSIFSPSLYLFFIFLPWTLSELKVYSTNFLICGSMLLVLA